MHHTTVAFSAFALPLCTNRVWVKTISTLGLFLQIVLLIVVSLLIRARPPAV